MIVDSHIHTCFSTDSQMTICQALQKANELGIGITITEHMDIDYPEPEAFIFDVNDYFNEYGKYRSANLLLGIEIGMRQDCVAQNSQVIMNQPFDYILGSIHVVDNIEIHQPEFYQQRTKQEVYHQYFTSMTACLTGYDFIDALGHIDYIARYAKFDDPEVHYQEFCEHIDQVLTALAERQKAIEINTRRLADKEAIQALVPIYKRFYDLGGRLATVGSDAHRPEDIGRDLTVALNIAESCNLKAVWFKNRIPQYLK